MNILPAIPTIGIDRGLAISRKGAKGRKAPPPVCLVVLASLRETCLTETMIDTMLFLFSGSGIRSGRIWGVQICTVCKAFQSDVSGKKAREQVLCDFARFVRTCTGGKGVNAKTQGKADGMDRIEKRMEMEVHILAGIAYI